MARPLLNPASDEPAVAVALAPSTPSITNAVDEAFVTLDVIGPSVSVVVIGAVSESNVLSPF